MSSAMNHASRSHRSAMYKRQAMGNMDRKTVHKQEKAKQAKTLRERASSFLSKFKRIKNPSK